MAEESSYPGRVISRGIVNGRAWLFAGAAEVPSGHVPTELRGAEVGRLRAAIEIAAARLSETVEKVKRDFGESEAEIFEGHRDILMDADLANDMAEVITSEGLNAERAALRVAEAHAQEMEDLEEAYFQARAEDFRDLGRQIVAVLTGSGELAGPQPATPSIVVAESLTPSQTARFRTENLLGLVTRTGSRNSHAAIMARRLEIPAVVLDGGGFEELADGDDLLVDGLEGRVVRWPAPRTVHDAERRATVFANQRRHLGDLRGETAVTLDGRRIRLLANAGGVADVTSALEVGAEGVGLFRTEFLFMEQEEFPNQETQYRVYRNVMEAARGRPVTFRLLDIGGDKPLPYCDHPPETNPFLGWRGIRFHLDHRAALADQLEALIRASELGPVNILVPMVSQASEVRAVKALLDHIVHPGARGYRLGIMVETPAAALTLDKFVGLIEFVSIGSNDLTQYVLAAARDNPRVAALYDDLHPAVLTAVALAAKTARRHGLGVCACGELAGRPEASPLLVGAGVEELSMAAPSIPEVKATLRALEVVEAEALLRRALAAESAAEVGALCHEFLGRKGLSFLSSGG